MAGVWEKWHQFREAIVIIDDLDVALATWGLTAPRLAALISLTFFVLGMSLGQGIFWSLFAAVLAFPAVMHGLIKIHEWRENIYPPPDLDRWRRVDVLAIWMAASLWAERNPTPVITPSSRIYPYLQQLKGAVEAGKLQPSAGSGDMKTQVQRAALVEYAKSIGEAPRFLEPEILD